LPFLFFVLTKRIGGSFIWKSSFLFVLGGLQGFFGWYMVKSGLIDNPHVSHYRLALHLVTAFITFSYTFWLILQILYPNALENINSSLKKLTWTFLLLLFVQIIYGAFVAGMKAGLFYNTWPKMDGKWIAEGVSAMEPFYLNLIESVAGVQFVHRTLAMIILFFGVFFLVKTLKSNAQAEFKLALKGISLLLFLQVVLGILTLIWALPLTLALAHQIVAFFLLMSTLYALRLSAYRS
jgi:cytochrome c oxidase assembly protein subunit 15